MSNITYKPADILHWFGQDAKRSKGTARRRSMDIVRTTSEEGIVKGLRQAVGVATSLGRGAVGDIVQARIDEITYTLHENGLEYNTLTKNRKIGYEKVRRILAKPGDRYQVLYDGGAMTIKPIAHLVAGRLRVPVGWIRNNMEVPYTMLVEELSARCGVEIDAE